MEMPLFLQLSEELCCVDDKLLKIEAKKSFDIVMSTAKMCVLENLVQTVYIMSCYRSVTYEHADATITVYLIRPSIMQSIFKELSNIDYIQAQNQEHKYVRALTTRSTSSSKDPFLNLSTVILGTIFKHVFQNSKLTLLSDDTSNQIIVPELYPTLHNYISSNTLSKDGVYCDYNNGDCAKVFYLTPIERVHQCPPVNEISIIKCGIFKVAKTCDEHMHNNHASLLNYLTIRFQELIKHAQSRLEDDNQQTVDSLSQNMLPFIVVYDFFASAAPFDPSELSSQRLRDATFILYNIARMVHLTKSFSELVTSTDETDASLLTSNIEWEIVCQLVMFYKILRDNVLEPFASENGGTLKLHKLLQYLTKLAKSFSKYYSSTKILTHEEKDRLIIRMNTRMQLVRSVYNVFVFSLRDLMGVPIVLTM